MVTARRASGQVAVEHESEDFVGVLVGAIVVVVTAWDVDVIGDVISTVDVTDIDRDVDRDARIDFADDPHPLINVQTTSPTTPILRPRWRIRVVIVRLPSRRPGLSRPIGISAWRISTGGFTNDVARL